MHCKFKFQSYITMVSIFLINIILYKFFYYIIALLPIFYYYNLVKEEKHNY